MNYELEMARFEAAEAERKLNNMRFQQNLEQKYANQQYADDSDRVDRAQNIAEAVLAQGLMILHTKEKQEKDIAEQKSNIAK